MQGLNVSSSILSLENSREDHDAECDKEQERNQHFADGTYASASGHSTIHHRPGRNSATE